MDAYRAAYNTWQEKTEWVQKDKRFDVLLPWGKHRADVLKEYIERLESQLLAMTVHLANAESKCRELAAESGVLKKAAEFATAPDMWIEQADGMLDYRYFEWYVDVLKAAMETPATDAFLAEVRASALDDFAQAQDEQAKKYYERSPGCSGQNECQFAAGQAWYFAECIRKGVQS